MTPRALERPARQAIARQFLPSRWDYHYTRSKLASDPLYAGVAGALDRAEPSPERQPLLDLGCGIGLLAHYLAACGAHAAYLGIDNDAGKVGRARAAAERAGLAQTRFELVDLATSMPAHQGDVCILDVLQFVPWPAQAPLLEDAADRVAPGGRLVIRTGLAGTGWRMRVTRAVDRLSRTIRWMNAAPKRYPDRAWLDALLRARGLAPTISPLSAGTPFNNWLVIAERPAAPGSGGSVQR